MADEKFSTMPSVDPLNGTELLCLAQAGLSKSMTAEALADYVTSNTVTYGDGIIFDDISNTVSADINTTNFQFRAEQINTIQDIDTTAFPVFETMTLNAIDKGFLMPRLTTVAFQAIAAPTEGLESWSTSTKRYQIWTGSEYKQLSYFEDIPDDSTSFASLSFDYSVAAVETVISAVNVYVDVNGTFLLNRNLNFTNVNGVLTYTGIETKEFLLSGSFSATLNASNATIIAAVFKNGITLIAESQQSNFLGSTSPADKPMSIVSTVELSNGDTLQIKVKNIDSTDNVTFTNYSFIPSTIGGAIGNIPDQVVIEWNNSTSPVSVLGSTLIDITGGTITTSAEVNVISQYAGSTTPVNLQAGDGIALNPDGTISAVGGPGGESLEQAYSNGADASMTQVAGRNVTIISTDADEPANFDLYNSNAALAFLAKLGRLASYGKNSSGAKTQFSSIETQMFSNTAGSEKSRKVFYVLVNGTKTAFIEIQGDAERILFHKQLELDGNFTQSSGDVEFNSTILSGKTFRIYGASTYLNGADQGIIKAVTSSTKDTLDFGVFPTVNGNALNFTKATGVPIIEYNTSGVWYTVWASLNGSNLVGNYPNTPLEVGQSISVDISGNIFSMASGGTPVSGQLRFSFGTIFSVVSQSISFTGTNQRSVTVSLKITRLDSLNITASVVGWYANVAGTMVPFQIYINPVYLTYDEAITNEILVEWKPTFNAGNGMDFVAKVLTITQHC